MRLHRQCPRLERAWKKGDTICVDFPMPVRRTTSHAKWEQAHEISSVQIYWFDDTGRGECRLPASWRVLYKGAEGEYRPVKNRGPYGIAKDSFNKVEFDPVATTAIKVEIVLQRKWSARVQEVVIE